jgi:hypothetical protein
VAVTFGAGAWSFQPEVLYVSKGTSFGKSDLTDASGTLVGTFETSFVVNYLEIPLLTRLGFRSRETVSPYLIAGPAVGFRTSQDFQFSGGIQGKFGIDSFNAYDLGLALGSGFELGLGAYRGLFEVRYTIGLVTAVKDPPFLSIGPGPIPTNSNTARNGDLLVMAGLVFQP